MSRPQSYRDDLAQIERREVQLWSLTLLLLIVFLAATLISFYLLLGGESVLQLDRSSTLTASVGLAVLTALFCVYVVQSHSNFSRMRRLLSAQAMRDPLTGLLNRQSFDDRINTEMARSRREGGLLAFLLCDLDEFKQINDTLGHHAGDEALQEVADQMKKLTRGSDLVFRWGGDEMLVLLSQTSREGVLIAAERLREGVAGLDSFEGLKLDMSVGVSLFPEHGEDQEQLLQLADRALYIAKQGGGKVHVGQELYPVDKSVVDLVFQPVVDSERREILGYEALSRDAKGQIGIEELFRRYQAVGQLKQLKDLIFGLQLRETGRLGLGRVFLNVDFDMLRRMEPPELPEGSLIVLEVSERDLAQDIHSQLEVAERWRRKGYQFAIDDFGSGFIALPFIARLIPDFIKMNRATIREATLSAEFSSFLRDLIVAMRNYSPQGVIAEGIETEEELEAARGLGVLQVQGYLTGRPEPIE
jgi:diguanylate cyclase (GGDEF)-like protein